MESILSGAGNENLSVGEHFVVHNDGCEYYKFTQFGRIGKYDTRQKSTIF